MKFSGKHLIAAPVEVIWAMILDPLVLEKITPGVKQLEVISEDVFKATSEVGIGPVRGVFEGDLSITDKVMQDHCVLQLDQKSKMGNVKAAITINLNRLSPTETEIKFNGDARLSGLLARMGQRIVGGVISTMSKQFFKALEKEIEDPPLDTDSEE